MGVYRMLLTSKVKKISGVEVGVLEYGYKAGDEEPYWSGDDKLAKRCQLLENNAKRRWDSKETPEYVVEYGYKEGRWVWKWWDGRPILAVLVFGIPAGLSFWYATKVAFLAMDEVWGPRFLGFCMSYVTFPILAWYLMNESMLTTKTLLCILLSFCIISIQLFWKT
jgi:hypothetical protein